MISIVNICACQTLDSITLKKLQLYEDKSELKGIFFISILAYHLLHSIEYTLNQQGITSSGKTIMRLMNTHTYSIIQVPTVNKTTITIRKPGTLEGIHDHIYRKLVVNSILKTSAKIATLEKLL